MGIDEWAFGLIGSLGIVILAYFVIDLIRLARRESKVKDD